LTQAVPAGQAFPHEPQFSRSTLVSVQVPLQRIVPTGQIGLLAARAELPIIPKARSTRIYVILPIMGVKFISGLISSGYTNLWIMRSVFSELLLAGACAGISPALAAISYIQFFSGFFEGRQFRILLIISSSIPMTCLLRYFSHQILQI
jgi:hypothetical protein